MKKKLGVVFGGMSNEHDVSVISASSVVRYLDKNKYEILLVYIDKDGCWYYSDELSDVINFDLKCYQKVENICDFLKQFEVIFPVLHGKYGEDGTIQGLFEMLGISYVGCGVLSSAIAMDKVITKIVLDRANIKQAKYCYVKKTGKMFSFADDNFSIFDLDCVCDKVEECLKYPIFVKPANSGSSIGISKVVNKNEMKKAIEMASSIDDRILFEENIDAREIECAVLGNDDVKVSCLGEIKPASDYYTYDAKYNDASSQLIIPANLNDDLTHRVRDIAKKAYQVIDGKGLSRIDFFVNEENNEIYLNEINTMPGFTNISMYPKLWENSGIVYSELLDELINLALEKKK